MAEITTKLSVTIDDATHRNFERVKELYGLSHKVLSLVAAKQLERFTLLDPSPKLKRLIRDYALTNNPVYLIQAEDEFSRLFEYDMYYQKMTLGYEGGVMPHYWNAEQYKRLTGLDNWEEHQKRRDKSLEWDWIASDYPEFKAKYPTFFHWEKEGCPEFVAKPRSDYDDEYDDE